MSILEAAAALNPGTAWNLNVDSTGVRTLTQAQDGTPRVQVPSLATLDAYVLSHAPISASTILGAAPTTDAKLTALIGILQAKGLI